MGWTPFPFGEPATILRAGPGTRDQYGNQVPGVVTEIPVTGAVWAPTSTTEVLQGQDALHLDGTLHMPPDTTVLYTDQVRFRGAVYNVYGQPTQAIHPRTGTHGPVSVTLQRIVG